MITLRVLPIGLVFSLQCLLVACGGGGGSSGDNAATNPSNPEPGAECFADYNSEEEGWDAYRSNRGRAVYSQNNGRSLYSLNLASGDISLISADVNPSSSSPQLSTTGRYIIYSTGALSAPVYDQEEGRVLKDTALVSIAAIDAAWAPHDTALLQKHILGTQIFTGPLFRNQDSIIVAEAFAHAWSPDGNLLVTASADAFSFYRMSPIRLVNTVAFEPGSLSPRNLSIDPTGNYLAYTTSGVPENSDTYMRNVHLLDLSTLQSSIIFSTADVGGISPDYAWAPSGKFIAIPGWEEEPVFSLNIYSIDAQSMQVIEGAGRQVWEYQWAPGADRLLFLRYDGDREYSLHLMGNPATAESKRVSVSDLEFIESIEWSPNSRYFSYVSASHSDESRLYAGDAQVGCFKEVEFLANTTSGPYGTASWSPSGQYLLYQALVGDNSELLVVRPDGSGKLSLTQVVAPPGSGERISNGQWTLVSDTVYLKTVDAATGSSKSLNFLEIDSLSQITVDVNGVLGFSDKVYMTE